MAMGMDMLMGSLLKGMGLQPEQIMQQVQGIFQLAMRVDERMARIEQSQVEILALLKDGTLSPEQLSAIEDQREKPNA